MKIELPLLRDSDNSHPGTLDITMANSPGVVKLTLWGPNRDIELNCNDLRRALRALQDYEEGEY